MRGTENVVDRAPKAHRTPKFRTRGRILAAVTSRDDAHSVAIGRLQLEVLAEQRRKLGDDGAVSLEMIRRIERILDFDEARV